MKEEYEDSWKIGKYKPNTITYNAQYKYFDGMYVTEGVPVRVYVENMRRNGYNYAMLTAFSEKVAYSYCLYTDGEGFTERGIKILATKFVKRLKKRGDV